MRTLTKLACLATFLASAAPAGANFIIHDPAGDTPYSPFADIRGVAVGKETPTTFKVALQLEDLLPASASVNPPGLFTAGVVTTYGVRYCLDNMAPGSLACYQAQVTFDALGVPQPSWLYATTSGTCFGWIAGPALVGFAVHDDRLVWELDRDAHDLPAGSCAPATTGGASPGTTVSCLTGVTSLDVSAVVIGTNGLLGADSAGGCGSGTYTLS